MMQKSERDNRGDPAHTSTSDRSARFFEFCNQAVSLMLELDHNQRPAVKLRYCRNGRRFDGYYHDQS